MDRKFNGGGSNIFNTYKDLTITMAEVDPIGGTTYPLPIDTAAKRALYENLDNNEYLATAIDA